MTRVHHLGDKIRHSHLRGATRTVDHGFHELPFTSLMSERRDNLPDLKIIQQRIASALLAHCEVAGYNLGLYSPPKEITEVRVTVAVMDQIRCV